MALKYVQYRFLKIISSIMRNFKGKLFYAQFTLPRNEMVQKRLIARESARIHENARELSRSLRLEGS